MSKLKKWSPLIVFVVIAALVALKPAISALTTKHGAFQKQIDYEESFDLKKENFDHEEEIAFITGKLMPSTDEPTFYVFKFNNITTTVYYVANVKVSDKDPGKLIASKPYSIKSTSGGVPYNDAMEELEESGFTVRFSSEDVTIYEKTYDGETISFGGIDYKPEYFVY